MTGLNIDRNHYLTLSVIYNAALKFSPFRQNARKLVRRDFFTSQIVKDELTNIIPRRKTIYRKILIDLFPEGGNNPCVNKAPIDFVACYRVGTTDHYSDDTHLKILYEGVIDGLGLSIAQKMNTNQADQFRRQLVYAIKNNKVELSMVYFKLISKEEMLIKYDDETIVDKVHKKIRSFISQPEKRKIDLRIISECLTHATYGGVESVIVGAEDDIFEITTSTKILDGIKSILGYDTQHLEMRHVSNMY